MPDIERGDFTIHYEVTRDGDGPTLLLIAGLGEQIGSVEYPDEQCDAFAAAGFRVVRMDNRDTGLSVPRQELPEVDPMGTLMKLVGGEQVPPPPYTLLAMADDAAAVVERLGVSRVHVVGASLGGFIGRWLAIRHAARVASLTVVMSGCGAGPGDDGPMMGADGMNRMVEMTKRLPHAEAVDLLVEKWRWLWGNAYPFDESWVRERVEHAFARSYRPEGIGRALLAAICTPGIWTEQQTIRCPTLVMHGGADPCFPPEHAATTARRIPGAELWLDSSMGHIMHPEQWPEMATRLAALARDGAGASAT